MRKNLFLQVVIISIVALTGCKEEKEETKPLTRSQILASHSWKLEEEITQTSTGTTITNQTNMITCSKDDFIIFKEDGSLIFDKGPDKCDPSNSQIYTTYWALLQGEKQLELFGSKIRHIMEMNEDKFILKDTSQSSTITTSIYVRK